MKKIFFVLFCLSSFLFSQNEEVDTLFVNVSSPVLSVGVSGGATFIDPEMINSQIEFNNTVFDAAETPIRHPSQFAVWLAFRPKNIPNYLSLRGEMISSSRTFPFLTGSTNDTGGTRSPLTGSSVSRYNVYPISINTGQVIPKTRIKMEIGFVYAIALFTDETEIEGGGTYENTYEGTGYGFRVMAQQVVPIDRSVSFTLEFSYRYLVMDEFRDPRGRSISGFEANYNGIVLTMGLSYGL
ncbi:MAG: hypothetical protein AB1728_09585 [Bacteroidota bacterium]